MPLLAHKPVQDKLVLAAHIQVGEEGRALGPLRGHHAGLVPVFVLDHKGVELALWDRPVQAQGTGGHICDGQLAQAWWGQGLPRLFPIPVCRGKAKQANSTVALPSSLSLPSARWLTPA